MKFRQTTLEEQISIAEERFRVFPSAGAYHSVRDMATDLELYITADKAKAEETARKLHAGELQLNEDGCIVAKSD